MKTVVKNKALLKSGVWGFAVGIILIPIATLGLVSGLVELLRPVLIPGIDFIKNFFDFLEGTSIMIIIGAILNGAIYSVLFILITLVKISPISSYRKIVVIAIILLIFLAVSGMLTTLHQFAIHPDKSWIFNIGA